jgi:hypothetical protein
VVAEAAAGIAAAGHLDAVYCPMHGGMRATVAVGDSVILMPPFIVH